MFTPGPVIEAPTILIATSSPYMVGQELLAHQSGSAASAVWPAANRALFVPLYIPATCLALKLFIVNGATVSGNVDVGIYSRGGSRLVASGSTAQAGVSTLQEFNITDTVLPGPEIYFLALAVDNVTATILRYSPGLTAAPMLGMFQMTTAFVLPATATFESAAANYTPVLGLSLRTLV